MKENLRLCYVFFVIFIRPSRPKISKFSSEPNQHNFYAFLFVEKYASIAHVLLYVCHIEWHVFHQYAFISNILQLLASPCQFLYRFMFLSKYLHFSRSLPSYTRYIIFHITEKKICTKSRGFLLMHSIRKIEEAIFLHL